MMDDLAHRGPDAEGRFAGRRGTLGHRRLSIMDLEGGDQPIAGSHSRRSIVGNGEIYNDDRLRENLEPDAGFTTRSDTESALRAYEERGTDAAGDLDGMFAFAIADGDDLYVARDPVGIKPLYYAENEGRWTFASELKAIADVEQNVREFPPGCWYHSRTGFHRFHEFEPRPVARRSAEDHATAVRRTLERAVGKRLMSDVPVGAFLSGGLDSSVIAALIRPHVAELHTFSVGIAGSRDLLAAKQVADHLDTIHHEYAFTVDEILEALPEIVFHLESFDQDLVRSAIPCFFVSRLAADHVKVIMTGEGADELFAGYTYYADVPDQEVLHRELLRSVRSMHNVNLQRVDRMTMAHSLEGRVPFLDLEMIELAQTVPVDVKLREDTDGRRVEKWVLRKACEDLLPHDIVWRKKEQFDEGSGTVGVVEAAVERFLADEPAQYAARHDAHRLRSPEECAYHALLVDAYSNPEPVLANVGRWADRPELASA